VQFGLPRLSALQGGTCRTAPHPGRFAEHFGLPAAAAAKRDFERRGEPLVNPQFFLLVDLLAERGIRCAFFTNGTLLRPQVRHSILARDNIDRISISCDGARPETFEALRQGADFAKWKELVGLFLAEARGRRTSLRLVASILVSTRNLSELPDILRLVGELGFESATLLDPIPFDEETAALCPSDSDVAALIRSGLLGLEHNLNLKIDWCLRRPGAPPRSIVRCIQPWEYAFIRANGDVAPCCALFGSDKAAIMGNVLQESFRAIWRGERFREFRAASASGTNPLCAVCPYY